jgi:hypothetical protein
MKGSCLCGAIEYEIDRLDMPICHCHCHTCRKANAAAFVSTAGVMREHFRWVKGKEKLTAFESSPAFLFRLWLSPRGRAPRTATRHCARGNARWRPRHQTGYAHLVLP